MSSTSRNRRLSRIRRRGSPELVAALEVGQISLRTADTLFYLSHKEQLIQLRRRLAAAAECQRRSNVAAATIRRYLDSTKEIDLKVLRDRIRAALATGV